MKKVTLYIIAIIFVVFSAVSFSNADVNKQMQAKSEIRYIHNNSCLGESYLPINNPIVCVSHINWIQKNEQMYFEYILTVDGSPTIQSITDLDEIKNGVTTFFNHTRRIT